MKRAAGVSGACVDTCLSDVLLLLLAQGQLDEDLLQLLIAVVDDELLEAVVLWEQQREEKSIP